MKNQIIQVSSAALFILVIVACTQPEGAAENGDHDHAHAHDHPPAVKQALAVMRATEGNSVSGTVHFSQQDGKVTITAEISGLEADSKHAIHVHEYGDLRKADGTGTGGHYTPEGHDHGLPGSEGKRHAGDFGNLEADAEGVANFELTVDNLSINGAKNPIIGRAVIIHAKADDGGQPTGNAGPRIAQGVIGVANPDL